MNKKQIKQQIESKYSGVKVRFKEYDASFVKGDQTYVVKVVRVHSKQQLTINSTIIWEIKNGKVDGARFIPTSSRLLDLREFMSHRNRIVVLTEEPYRILQCLNEADIIDASDKDQIHNTWITTDIDSIYEKL